ncbi:phospholipase A and acyltransferase 4-like [Saccopteryx leptura]|uniref:phospholipase A and acyltransferase 4-like n=1 Tax=Saccopteryx leptura TaxID=249018 RepID=UPI00339D24F1
MASSDPAEPELGDLIEFFRKGYSHWAIYVGDGYVVHLTTPVQNPGAGSSGGSSSSSSSGSLHVLNCAGQVKRELLTHVAEGSSYRVNNRLDREYKPRPVNEMIRSAKEMIGEEMRYSLLMGNCEHFVTDLRYGKAESRQVEKVLKELQPTIVPMPPSGCLLF